MPSIGYAAPPDTVVYSGALTMKFTGGHYTTSDLDEIAALDAVAELESHPITFAPADKKG